MIAQPTIKRFTHLFFLICTLFLLASCESRRAIAHGLDEKEANEIIVVLEPRGIKAQKVQEASGGGGATDVVTWKIEVADEQATAAMSILNQLGLPRRRGKNLLNIFEDSGLVPSELQERIKYEEGLAESIASSIRKMDGVLDADVRLSFPKEDPLNPQKKSSEKVAASVYVKHAGALDDPNSLMVQRIKRLVAGSVVGLDYDNVTVIPDRARYAEESLRDLERSLQEEKQYVNIWTVTVARDSASTFRILFFSFTISILILVIVVAWIGWKLWPLLEANGGIKSLFTLNPITRKRKPKSEGEEESEEEESEPDEEEEEADSEGEEPATSEPGDMDEELDERR